jgi:Glycosyl transferase family 2
MTTIITHFYNEEYLLPRWLKHHKELFDHGILVDYRSTDNSREIINELCPDWEVLYSKNQYFDASAIDNEIMEIESRVQGLKTSITVTEFFYGDYSLIKEYDEPNQIVAPIISVIDTEWGRFDENKSMLSQITHGVTYTKNINRSGARSLHNFPIRYLDGRHFGHYNQDDLVLLKMQFFPMNDKLLARKLQIQTKIGRDYGTANGWQHHNHGKGLSKNDLLEMWESAKMESEDIVDLLKSKNSKGNEF